MPFGHCGATVACGCERLLNLHARLYEQSERYRLPSAFGEVSRKVAEAHQEIVELALARASDTLIDKDQASPIELSDRREEQLKIIAETTPM